MCHWPVCTQRFSPCILRYLIQCLSHRGPRLPFWLPWLFFGRIGGPHWGSGQPFWGWRSPLWRAWLLFLGLWLALACPPVWANQEALTCRAPALGPACGTESSPWLLPLAGNPIDLIHGNKYLPHTDVWPLKGAPLMFIQRHYNAHSNHQSILGQGWSLHWDIRLQPALRQLWLADGRHLNLDPNQLQQTATTDYQLQLNAQTRLWFNPQGYLMGWQEAGRGRLHIERYEAEHPQLSQQIRRLRYQQQQLDFLYVLKPNRSQPLLYAIQGPFGQIRYHYESGQGLPPTPETQTDTLLLQQVHYPDGRALAYHYEQPEHPQALTGYSFRQQPTSPWTRLAYWRYDPQGRAFFSARAGGEQWLRIIYHPPQDGRLRRQLISAEGQSDYYFDWQDGQWIFGQYTGAACPGCLAWVRGQTQPTKTPAAHKNTQAPSPAPETVFGLYPTPLPIPESLTPDSAPETQPQLLWSANGHQRQLRMPHSPWPELNLHYAPHGQLTQWHSSLTGTTQIHRTPEQLRIHYANGDQAELIRTPALSASGPDPSPDAHTPVTLTLNFGRLQPDPRWASLSPDVQRQWQQALGTPVGHQPLRVQLHQASPHRLHIEHPNEQSWWQWNADRQLVAQQHQRTLHTAAGNLQWHYAESFAYDDHGHLREHHLLEGGQLIYQRDAQQTLQAIIWQPAQGSAVTLLQRIQPGLWRHHNGLYSYYQQTESKQSLWVFGPEQWLGLHEQIEDQDSSTARQHQIWLPTAEQADFWQQTLLYDHQQRLVGASEQGYWSWDQQGQNQGGSLLGPQTILRDPSGLPMAIHTDEYQRQLLYNPQRRLTAVLEQEQLIAAYQHNAFGYRIYAHYPQLRPWPHRFFIFHQQQLVAEWYGSDAELEALGARPQRHPIKKRYVYLGDQPVALIDYQSQTPEVYAIHSQFVGAPIAMTNRHSQTVWQAHYQALGAASMASVTPQPAVAPEPDWHFPLRYPGHYADPVTGWHDNLLRTHDPQRGHYLEPDPLGPIPGQQPLGYAQQQPWHWIDPLGLVLFAFDGTRYDSRLNSNVWQFQTLYEETAYYQSGPGNASYLDWDALTAWRAHRIIETQWQHLLNEILWQAPEERLAIDIIGFSRGAALARHFAQQIMQQTHAQWFHYVDDFGRQFQACLQPRFIGLFDTVAQFGLLGSHNQFYQFDIAPEWAWVAHAVALNEYRQLFPLYAIETDEHRLQAGFIGAHRDIGGGKTESEASAGDLDKISLQWMLWQARAVGLSLGMNTDTAVTNPLLHDDRLPYLRYLSTDRHVQTATDSAPQWLHPELGQSARAQVESFVQRFEGWQRHQDSAVGTVDLQGYYQWLEHTLGWRPDAQ